MKLDRSSLSSPQALWLGFVLLGLFGYLLYAFAAADGLTSFADDGVSYLIMAQHYSPYGAHSALIDAAYVHERYPPLFPVLLALTGAAHNTLLAHLEVILALLLATVLLWLWVARESASKWTALAVALVMASTPNLWPLALRVVSEPLYLVLTLAALLYAPRANEPQRTRLWIFVILLTAAMLTRAIAIALLAAWAIQQARLHLIGKRLRPAMALPLVIPLAVAVFWYLSRPADPQHHYMIALHGLADTFSQHGLLAVLAPQWHSLLDAWQGALMLIWHPTLNPRFVLATLLGLLAIAGLAQRLRRNTLDAWYVLCYLAIILLWPFPGQMPRFLFPILPLLIFYSFELLTQLASRGDKRLKGWAPVVASVALLALTTPADAFIYTRFHYSDRSGFDYRHVPEFYFDASFDKAKRRASMHLILRRDLAHIRATTPAGATVMWVTPNYMTLLAQRRSVPFPLVTTAQAVREQVVQEHVDYIYLSHLDPRRTGDNGLAWLPLVRGLGRTVWATTLPGSNEIFSVLIALVPAAGD